MKKKHLYHLLLLLIAAVIVISCKTDEEDTHFGNDPFTSSVLIVYMPWTGNADNTYAGLLEDFKNNIKGIEEGIKKEGGIANGLKIMVFLSKSAKESELYLLTYKDGAVKKNIVKTYTSTYSFNTSKGLASLLSTVKTYTNADSKTKYGLIIGGHGTGWTAKDAWEKYPTRARRSVKTAWKAPLFTMTRFIGSVSDKEYAMDVDDVARGIKQADIKLQYLLFDNCYMANVETAYALKDVTSYLIASTSEILAVGMPYKDMYAHLNPEKPNYKEVVSSFKKFFDTYSFPYGALSVIDCSKTEPLAEQMKKLNHKYTIQDNQKDYIQKLGGFEPTIFFDILSYVKQMKPSEEDFSIFRQTLQSTVIASTSTKELLSVLYGGNEKYIPVEDYSGLTISDPTTHPVALKTIKSTHWWKATH